MGHVVCFFVTVTIVFLTLSVWKGGDVFRAFGKKADGIVSGVAKSAGYAADAIKKTTDPIVKIVKAWFAMEEKNQDKNEGKEKQTKDDGKKSAQPDDKKAKKLKSEKRSN
jgi:hypothetical protein